MTNTTIATTIIATVQAATPVLLIALAVLAFAFVVYVGLAALRTLDGSHDTFRAALRTPLAPAVAGRHGRR